jgi:uncharacterized protein YjeT (DUF2065 family)
LLAVGREMRPPSGVAATGGVAVIAGLVVLAVLLVRIVTPALQRRFDPAVRFYLTALLAGVVDCAFGLMLLSGERGAGRPRLLAAHLTLNLLGLVGLVIVGTLPFVCPIQPARRCRRAKSASTMTDIALRRRGMIDKGGPTRRKHGPRGSRKPTIARVQDRAHSREDERRTGHAYELWRGTPRGPAGHARP